MIDFKFFSKILGFKPTYTRNEVMLSADKTREIINNHTFMATPPDPTQPLILLGLLSVAGVTVGAMAARRQL